MHIEELSVQNFRAIKNIELVGLSKFVLIAGPNGCGKSCIFDAVRLLKSFYGGYQPNEIQHFFSEFQLDVGNRVDLLRVFRDPSKPLRIAAKIALSEPEKSFIRENAGQILMAAEFAIRTNQQASFRSFSSFAFLSQNVHMMSALQDSVAEAIPVLMNELGNEFHELELVIDPSTSIPQIKASLVAKAVFSTYYPENIGLIEYHSATRAYQREMLGGIDLNVRNFDDQRMQSTLYNSQNKYSNIKTELAATYLRDLVVGQTGSGSVSGVNETIKQLFELFLPGKEYLGVRPDESGSLAFPVRLSTGETHDINELSSGEKELVYGYLRLRNSAPKNSVILLDEPELHLNPALMSGLTEFYDSNLGIALNNQLWLVTHSDALLRDAMMNVNFNVFHMVAATNEGAANLENQAISVADDSDLEAATVSLVGDLAAYKPLDKVVVVEGGGDSQFDCELIAKLYPEFAKKVNLISGQDRRRVQVLFEALENSGDALGVKGRYFSIVDRDSEPPNVLNERSFHWPVYHIENFLLSPSYIAEAVNTLCGGVVSPPSEIESMLIESANRVAANQVRDTVCKSIHDDIDKALRLKPNKSESDAVQSILPSLSASLGRIESLKDKYGNVEVLERMIEVARLSLDGIDQDQRWRTDLPGRDILKLFVGDLKQPNVKYETLRNVIIGLMAKDAHRPDGMTEIIDRISAKPIGG